MALLVDPFFGDYLPKKRCRYRDAACLCVVALLLDGCSTSPPAAPSPASPPASAVQPARPVALPTVSIPPPTAPGPDLSVAAEAQDRRAFRTRYARFSPAQWEQLPGWGDDDLSDAWRAFMQSCAALGKKPGWKQPCERARRSGNGNEVIRGFFEREFELYEIRNADQTPEGMITGYYEPLIAGSPTRQGTFVYPVYGEPADLLTLDIRLWPKALRDKPIGARIEGRRVIPMPDGNAPYTVAVGKIAPDERDKKLRLRRDGQQVVPYFTRAEISRDGLTRAPVLAWVDNPVALYSMQIQGSGKVRFPDGRILRLAYAEQNGHPFNPPVVAAAASAKSGRLVTRGLAIDLPGSDDDGEPESEPADHAEPLLTRGAPHSSAAKVTDAEVERMIEQLSGTAKGVKAPDRVPSARPPTPLPGSIRTPAANGPQAAAHEEPIRFAPPSPQALAAILTDPSYVFFRSIPDGPGGPIGALGVPLTAGGSVAVDPRTTPLGFPVFLSTARAGDQTRINRLVMAQDTGGAIRGAVRADYFWGFGANAYARASRMKDSGRMWLLLPIGQHVAARDDAPLTRGRFDPSSAPECVVSDPELCVEDSNQ